MKNAKAMTIRLSQDQAEALETVAAVDSMPVSDVIRTAIDKYKDASDRGMIPVKLDTEGYPPDLDTLVEGVQIVNSPDGKRLKFLRRIPRDPFATDPALAPAETWGRRSYASPPDEPKEGDDVFDVYSLAKGKGINGRLYREW